MYVFLPVEITENLSPFVQVPHQLALSGVEFLPHPGEEHTVQQ